MIKGKPIIEAFWVVEYNNGRVFAQYDPDAGKENLFKWVDHKNVLRMFWFPVTPALADRFPGLRVNPRLKYCGMAMNGSKGFVARRSCFDLKLGASRSSETSVLPKHRVRCYVVGIEGGPRVELYPDGSVIQLKEPRTRGATQDILHHG